eukprot:PhM_4_TR7805/c1_g1_i1/m.3489
MLLLGVAPFLRSIKTTRDGGRCRGKSVFSIWLLLSSSSSSVVVATVPSVETFNGAQPTSRMSGPGHVNNDAETNLHGDDDDLFFVLDEQGVAAMGAGDADDLSVMVPLYWVFDSPFLLGGVFGGENEFSSSSAGGVDDNSSVLVGVVLLRLRFLTDISFFVCVK